MSNADIIRIIYETSKGTAPVVVQFGITINNVCHPDNIIIKEAPALIISRLIEAGCSISICPDGAEVYKL